MPAAARARASVALGLVAALVVACAPSHARPRATGSTPGVMGTAPVAATGPAHQPGAPAGLLAQAADGYARYARAQATVTVRATAALVQAVLSGQLAEAKARYVPARVAYERIETLAESVDGLADAIDGRAADVSASSWRGFHRIEEALWAHRATVGTAGYARQLLTDVQRLAAAVDTLRVTPAAVAAAALGLVDQMGRTKVTGEEEPYSHLDLVDLAANLDGAQVAFDVMRPAVSSVDPALADTITERLRAAEAGLAAYRRGAGFEPYTALTTPQVRALAQSVDALGEPLSLVAGEVLGD